MKKGITTWKSGFSLIELIIAIAIIGIIGAVVAPNFVRYAEKNRMTACETDREAILAVFERCIYAKTKELTTTDLQAMLTGSDPQTVYEVQPYVSCPSNGSFSAEVKDDVAIIKCDKHGEVAIDLVGWDGTELPEGEDAALVPPPDDDDDSEEPTPDPDDPDPTPEGDPVDPTPVSNSYWPYADDSRWEGKRFPGQYVNVSVPSGVFTSKEGNSYVVIDKNGTGVFPVYWEWNLGPENIDTRGWEQCIAWSGILIEDVESLRYYQQQTDGTYVPTDTLTGIHYGDILIYKGKRYICASHDESLQKPFPTEGQNSGYYYLVEP